MSYDDLDRLSTASGLWGSGSYSYDALGNITSKTEGGETRTYHYDNNNRLTSITGASPVSYGTQDFDYNRAGNMLSSTGPSITYQYDGHKRRVQQTQGGQTEYTMYSLSGTLLHKKVGGVTTDYIYAGQMLIARNNSSTGLHYLHTDLLGSPIEGKAGSTGYTEHYTPWGEKLSDPIQLAEDVGYTGHQSDVATGLTYMQARYYDPVVGRFLTVDSIEFGVDNPMSFNRYAYVNNNPFAYTDPTGMHAHDDSVARSNARCKENPNCAVVSVGSGHRNKEAADAADVYTQERLGAVHRDASEVASHAGDALELVAEAEMLARGAKLAGAGFGILARTLGTKRALRTSDLGLEGRIALLRGTVQLRRGVLTMRVDMIKGEISNPMAVFRSMKSFAKGAGATTLQIEGRIGNSRLDALLRSRYGMRTRDDGVDVIEVLLD